MPEALTVLVVDDEDSIRNLLSLIVTRAGGRADVAASAAQARELLALHRYEVAILDKNLPDASGLALLQTIKAQAPTTEVLIVTGYASMDSAIEALRLGAYDYILKPFDVAAVTHRVKLALDRRRMASELDLASAELRRKNAEIAESRQEVKRAYLETVLRLSIAAEYRDDAARSHLRRISRYAGLLARAIDATEDWVENIVYAAPLHDIGKIGVPEGILRKAGALTAAERTAMCEHVPVGARILEGTTSDILALGREIVLTHHERWDGAGYPARLRGDAIPLSGRIVALADAWDAVSTDRVYRKAMPFDAALAEIRAGAGTHFDESLVTVLCDHEAQLRAILGDDQ